MNNPEETQIVWRLSKADKGRYVSAARSHSPPLPLIGWLKQVCDAAAPVAVPGKDRETLPETNVQRFFRELIEDIRRGLDPESGQHYLIEMAKTDPKGKEFIESIIEQMPERYWPSYESLVKSCKEEAKDGHEK